MNILILNWRDIKNPRAGGAEQLTHEIARRWVRAGHSVTQFSENFSGAHNQEVIDGVRLVRGGVPWINTISIQVHVAAFFWYLRQKKRTFDIVIDEIHGLPFFTPWYIKEKKVALICEVAGDLWNVAFSFPKSIIGRLIEKYYFLFYKNIPFLTISPSTKKELVDMGIKTDQITVIPMGLTVPKEKFSYPKEKRFTLIFVARMTKAKGIEQAIDVVEKIRKIKPEIQLWVIGHGSQKYTSKIKNRIRELKLDHAITLFGFISQKKKFELMTRAHILVVPSFKEGWGLTVLEAALVGTPAIGYKTAGVQDVIMDDKTGKLVDLEDVDMLSHQILRLWKDQARYSRYQAVGKKRAASMSWDDSARESLEVLESVYGKK